MDSSGIKTCFYTLVWLVSSLGLYPKANSLGPLPGHRIPRSLFQKQKRFEKVGYGFTNICMIVLLVS